MAGRELTITPTKRERRKSPAVGCGTDSSSGQQSAPPPLSPSSSVADSTFEPTVDMMVNDFDDEATLNEEEALADLEAHNAEDEIATLREESEMPIEQLLAKYGSMTSMQPMSAVRPSSSSSSSGGFGAGCSGSSRSRRATKRQMQEADVDETPQPHTSQAAPSSPLTDYATSQFQEAEAVQMDDISEVLPVESSRRAHRSHLLDLYPEESFASNDQDANVSAMEDLESFTPLQTLLEQVEDEEDEEEDSDTDSDDTRKRIMVGPNYQAEIPEGLSLYGDILPYENEDQLIWAPSQVSERAVEEFLAKIQETRVLCNAEEGDAVEPEELPPTAATARAVTPTATSTAAATPPVAITGPDLDTVVKDNEQALHLLVQCGYDFKEALRRKRLNVLPLSDTMSSWSEEECQKFEEGIQKFGKDFYKIRQNQVRTRTMRELVQFYYLWKKSERRDQSGALKVTIDHMDLFINETGNGNGSGSGSGNGNGSCSSQASSCSSSNGHSNGNAGIENSLDLDIAATAAVATTTAAAVAATGTSSTSPATTPRKSTARNYSIMTGGNPAAGTSRKRGVFGDEEDNMSEQENGVDSLS